MKKLQLVVFAVMISAFATQLSWAQTGTVKGTAKDESGMPIVGATVDMAGRDTGRKYKLTTDKKGAFFSLGIAPGAYDITLTDTGGKVIGKLNGFPIKLGDDNNVTFDVAKEKQAAVASMSEEQKKQIEAAQKENTKIKGLNEKLAQANAASEAGDYKTAVTILTETVAIDGSRDLIWAKLADAQRLAAGKETDSAAKKASYEASIVSYQKAIEIKPNGAYYNNSGEAYAKTGKVDEAVKAYQEAANLDPMNAGQYFFNLGAILTNSGKVDEAITAFDKALASDPTRADAYYWKGVNLMGKASLKGSKMEAPEGTAEAFNKYLELQPTGAFAQPAKDMLASIGADVQTSFGSAKKAPAPAPAKKK